MIVRIASRSTTETGSCESPLTVAPKGVFEDSIDWTIHSTWMSRLDDWICPRCKPDVMASIVNTMLEVDAPIEPIEARPKGTTGVLPNVTKGSSEMIELAPQSNGKRNAAEVRTAPTRPIMAPSQSKRELKRKAIDHLTERSNVVKIKLPSMAILSKSVHPRATKKKRKGEERVSPPSDGLVEEEEPPIPFGGLIVGRDADTTKTQIGSTDMQLYEETRRAAEVSRLF
jgi:hypothetical protein